MTTAAPRAALFTLGLLAALGSVSGCAGNGSEAPRSVARAGVDRQLMVTLPRTSPVHWQTAVAELQSEYALGVVAVWEMESLGVRCVLFDNLSSLPVSQVVRNLRGDRRIELAQVNQEFSILGHEPLPDDPVPVPVPVSGYDDPYAGLQYSIGVMGLDGAHRWSTGNGVDIAVVDTGIDLTHPDLEGRIKEARHHVRQDADRFTSDYHGTAVAGVIAATANNGEGIVGVAPAANLLAVKACWQPDPASRRAICSSYTLALALDFAVSQRVDIINLSLGGPSDPLLERLVVAALARGIVVVAASAPSPDGSKGFPASVAGVLAVAGCDAAGRLWPDGEGNATGRLVAPGAEILSLTPGRSYDFSSGSSLAAAHVTGTVALLLERDPNLSAAAIAEILEATAARLGTEGSIPVINACAALADLLAQESC